VAFALLTSHWGARLNQRLRVTQSDRVAVLMMVVMMMVVIVAERWWTGQRMLVAFTMVMGD